MPPRILVPEKVVPEAPLRKVETKKKKMVQYSHWIFRKSQEISNPNLKPFSIESRKTSRRGRFAPPPPLHPTSNRVKLKWNYFIFVCLFPDSPTNFTRYFQFNFGLSNNVSWIFFIESRKTSRRGRFAPPPPHPTPPVIGLNSNEIILFSFVCFQIAQLISRDTFNLTSAYWIMFHE